MSAVVLALLLSLRRHLAVKLLLNALSTTVMAKLDRVVGNTVAYVQPSNLELIRRATHLVRTHANDIRQAQGRGDLSHVEANLSSFEAIAKRRNLNLDTFPPKVILAVTYATLRQENPEAMWDDAVRVLNVTDINAFERRHIAWGKD